MDFLEEIVPTMGADYELQVERIVYAPGEKVAFGEFIEHLEVKGVMTDIPETIIFDFNDEGLIRRMSLYLKQPGGPAATLSTDTVTEKFSWSAYVSLVSLEYALSVDVPCSVVVLLPPHAARVSTGTRSAMYLMSTPPMKLGRALNPRATHENTLVKPNPSMPDAGPNEG